MNRAVPGAVETSRDGDRPLFVAALPVCGGRSIGDNALRRVAAITRSFRPAVISDTFPEVVPPGVETLRIVPRRFNFLRRLCHVPNELGFAWATRRALLALHRRQRIGFVLCHGYSIARFAGLAFRRKAGVPFGMFMHGHIFERPKGKYDSMTTGFYRRIAPTCYRESDLLFALSPAQARLAIQAGARSDRVIVTPNGLDLEDLGLDVEAARRKADAFTLHQPLRCLYVGRLDPEKGVDTMLRAFSALLDERVDFRLDLVGGGPERERLEQLAEDLGLSDRCKFEGSFPRRELGARLLRHDVLVVPSLSEPFGNVVIEGLAAACLVVASDTGGIPSVIRHGENGLLFPPGDSTALSRALLDVARGVIGGAEIVRGGPSWVRENSSWTVIGRRIEDAVASL